MTRIVSFAIVLVSLLVLACGSSRGVGEQGALAPRLPASLTKSVDLDREYIAMHMWQGTPEDIRRSDSYGNLNSELFADHHREQHAAVSMSFVSLRAEPEAAAATTSPTTAATTTAPTGVAAATTIPSTTPAATTPAATATATTTPSAATTTPAATTPTATTVTPAATATDVPTASAAGATQPAQSASTTSQSAATTSQSAAAPNPPTGEAAANTNTQIPGQAAMTNPPANTPYKMTPSTPNNSGSPNTPPVPQAAAATAKANENAESSESGENSENSENSWTAPPGPPAYTIHNQPNCPEFTYNSTDPHEIRVLSFNLWDNLGHTDDGVGAVVQLIKNVRANVIGLQEAKMDVVEEIAQKLGAPYRAYFPACIVSSLPPYRGYKERPGSEKDVAWFGSVSLKVGPDLVPIKFGNGHNFANNATKWLRDGGSAKDVSDMVYSLNYGSGGIVNPLKHNIFFELNDPELPIILMGDHNEPSILDHTSSASRNRAYVKARHAPVVPLKWPISSTLLSQGFIDSFRTMHPKFLNSPMDYGFTWHRNSPSALVTDRIDYIYSKDGRYGNWNYLIKCAYSNFLHSESCVWAKKDKKISQGLYRKANSHVWPSDHNAMFSVFTVTKEQV